ncbi:DUF934 domain-containing protein [soil metagenome]
MRNVIRLTGDVASVVEDDWSLPVAESEETSRHSGRSIVAFADWAETLESAPADAELAVLLPNDIDPEALFPLDPRVVLIAVDFPKFTDGRGYSIGFMVRRLGWTGELRAVGEVLRDQLNYLRRVGFDSFAIAAHRDAAEAIPGLFDFSDTYQASTTQPLPAFRREPAGFATVDARSEA